MATCRLELSRESGGRFVHRCPKCSAEVQSKYREPSLHRRRCGLTPPGGPGTELRKIFAELGIKPGKGCKCKGYARRMDSWGPSGCAARLPEIVAHLQDKAETFGLAAMAAAGWAALWQGKPLTIAGLVGLAIERAVNDLGQG